MTDVMSTPEPTGVPIEPKVNEAPIPAESSTPKAEPKPEVEAKPEKKDLDTILKDSLKKSQESEAKKPEAKSDPKVEAKPKEAETPEEKAERLRNPDGKFAPKEAKEPSEANSEEGAGKEGEKARPSEGRNIDVPPSRFTPKAKEKWLTADPEIRREMWRAHDEMEKGLNESKEDREFRKVVKPFEEMATAAGTNFHDAIKNYVEIDQMISADPVRGIQRVLAAQGIDLVQFSQHVLKQAQQAQADPKGAALNQYQQREQTLQQQLQQQAQQMQELQRSIMTSKVESDIIAPFAQQHPRFQELQGDIAFFLNSDKIPSTLNAQERLAAAYDYAERINPLPSQQNAFEPLTPAPATKSLTPAGQKSVTGAPSASAVTSTKSKGDATDLDAVLRRALSKAS